MQPLLEELKNLAYLACSHSSQEEARNFICSISQLVLNVQGWVVSNVPAESKEGETCKVYHSYVFGHCLSFFLKAILKGCLDQFLLVFQRGLHTQIAQRTLERCYPRLVLRPASQVPESSGESAILEWLVGLFLSCDKPQTQSKKEAYDSLDFGFDDLERQASTSDLVFYAYHLPTGIDIERLLSFLVPALISSIQANMFLNESLAILTAYLHAWQTESHGRSLSHDVTSPLCGLLPSVASAHPDPSVRHQSFRVLALLLSTADPRLSFQHLVDYTQDSQYPQLRVASVNLVKDALIKSLSNSKEKNDPFCSPEFLQSFGPILFRPNPPDLLTSTMSLQEFQETPESRRLIECLSLYYVLLQRDTKNLVKYFYIYCCLRPHVFPDGDPRQTRSTVN